jgi:hypothetical protein
MKLFLSKQYRLMEKLWRFVLCKTTTAPRVALRTEARQRSEMEAERLDRLRNPGDYRGR